MGITMAITELLNHGPEPWVTVLPGAAAPPEPPEARDLEAEEWDEFCCRVTLPVVEEMTGVAVASGAAGLWLHGHIGQPPRTELHLISLRPGPGTVWTTLGARAKGTGWRLEIQSPDRGLLVRPASAVSVRLIRPPLPDEALDGPRGYRRAAIADWALAVEALASAARASSPDEACAALDGLRFLLTDIPDVLWTHALRRLSSEARQSWLAAPHALSVPELRELADVLPLGGVTS